MRRAETAERDEKATCRARPARLPVRVFELNVRTACGSCVNTLWGSDRVLRTGQFLGRFIAGSPEVRPHHRVSPQQLSRRTMLTCCQLISCSMRMCRISALGISSALWDENLSGTRAHTHLSVHPRMCEGLAPMLSEQAHHLTYHLKVWAFTRISHCLWSGSLAQRRMPWDLSSVQVKKKT
jgi:hypothetical protein